MRARDVNDPQPGFYKIRLTRNGPFVGAVLYRPCPIEMDPEYWNWLDRGLPPVAALVNDEEGSIEKVWLYGREIDQAEYEYLVALAAWARAWDPTHPLARPDKPIDAKPGEDSGSGVDIKHMKPAI